MAQTLNYTIMMDFPILSLILFVIVCYVLISVGRYFNRKK